MARLGTFDAELHPPVLLDEEIVIEGWFDEDLIPAEGAAPQAPAQTEYIITYVRRRGR